MFNLGYVMKYNKDCIAVRENGRVARLNALKRGQLSLSLMMLGRNSILALVIVLLMLVTATMSEWVVYFGK